MLYELLKRVDCFFHCRANNKTNIFINEENFPDIQRRKDQIQAVRKEIVDHRREVRILLRQPSLDYVTVMGTEVSTL